MSRGNPHEIGPALGLILACIATSAQAAVPSKSKLGIHLIGGNTAGVTQICNAHPKAIKILDASPSMMAAVRNYKAGTPTGIVVLRVWNTKVYALSDNPANSASDFAATVLLPAFNSLSNADRALIDYVEGPNEGGNTPAFATLTEARWYNDFWVALAPLIANAGFKPCAFSIAVGNPDGTIRDINQKIEAIVPALRLIRDRGGAWSYHAYTPSWSTDADFQSWYSLRYRRFYSFFASSYPDLVNMPLILTEGGFDTGGNPTQSGWQANGTAAQFENWLTWWDAQIRQDSYVLGSTLFQIGSPSTWPSFDLEPIAGWMAAHLDTYSPPVIERSPATMTLSTYEGREVPAGSFTVRNVGGHTLEYSIADNAGWLSLAPTSGASTGETDAIAVNYSAAGLGAGSYSATITIAATLADNTPQTIPVTLTVWPRLAPGDLDHDYHVDSADAMVFQNCMTGPDAGPVSGACTEADLDDDTDVDQSDFAIMQRCMAGDVQTANPDCGA